ncbi:MAG TPA: class I SAM-dependent methyltransferase [Polyangiaceae bacterium]|nr:class I SAM-dependent methyltransferase [Polyangiaceae bacterium]
MRSTDYQRIAAIYDDAEFRHNNPPDRHLGAHLERVPGQFCVLDVACGTGNYLAAQRAVYDDPRITWHGIDASEAMLERARLKLEGCALDCARAEALPFDTASMHYLSNNFAFHHFADKARALDEMRRVLAAGGGLRITNIAPEYAPQWWAYEYFPQGKLEDQKRFWSVALLRHELEQRGFEVRAEVRITIERLSASEALRQARGRDQSSIAIVDEASFAAGIARLERDAEAGASIVDHGAFVEITAVRS